MRIRERTLPILLYHSVDTTCSPAYAQWMVTPETFDRQMSMIRDNGYHPITISETITSRRNMESFPERTIAITFDDGLRDFLTGALPILQKYQFSATLYAVSGLMGKTSRWLDELGEGNRPMMNWEELGELGYSNIEVGAHTVTHPQLDLLRSSRAAEEIRLSKQQIEDHTGTPVHSFAYPHGYSTARIQRAVAESGFTSACRVRHALSTVEENPFGISRIVITPDITDHQFLRFLKSEDLPVAPPPRRILTFGWRMVRLAKSFT